MNDRVVSIVELADLLGLSQSAIRKYEEDFRLNIRRNELGHREYTEQDIEVFKLICRLKDEGHNIHAIRRALNKNDIALEQKEKNLALTPIQEMNVAELQLVFQKSIMESMAEMQRQYENKLEQAKEEIKEEVRKEIEHQAEQIKSENQKLIDYLQKTREEEKPKGFLSRFFK